MQSALATGRNRISCDRWFGRILPGQRARPDAARLTKDVDIAVDRADLDRIAERSETFGLRHRHVAGIDMLVIAGGSKG